MVVVGVQLAGSDDGPAPPPSASTSPTAQDDETDGDWDYLIGAHCGAPGTTDFVTQAYCLLDATGASPGTDLRGLETIATDACRHDDIDAFDLASRIGPVSGRDAVLLGLTIRLARMYCGVGESLNYDGFEPDGPGPPQQAPGGSGGGDDARFLQLVRVNHPGASDVPDDELMEVGRQVCESLGNGMPLSLLIERGSEASSREFMYAVVTAANSIYCPEVVPQG